DAATAVPAGAAGVELEDGEEVGAAGDGAAGEAAGEDFGERGYVRHFWTPPRSAHPHAVGGLGAAGGAAEAGDDFVEDEEGALLLGEGAEGAAEGGVEREGAP